MKIIVNIILFLFLSFLSAPTIISLMQDDADVSIAYSLTEEELQKEIKEVKAGPEHEFRLAFFNILQKKAHINSENELRHENAISKIFSPPPEQV